MIHKDLRPRNESGTPFSTRVSVSMAELFGYETYHGVGFTSDETDNLAHLYNVDLSPEQNALETAGTKRNIWRLAVIDGLRVMALLAKYCEHEHEEDPVQLVAQGLAALGFDIACDDQDEEEIP